MAFMRKFLHLPIWYYSTSFFKSSITTLMILPDGLLGATKPTTNVIRSFRNMKKYSQMCHNFQILKSEIPEVSTL